MGNHTAGYAALCVALPVAWGLLVYKISSTIERKVQRKKSIETQQSSDAAQPEHLPLTYHI